jgi:HD-like signal output (HDOD) protein
MGNLISWIVKIFRPGYAIEGNQVAAPTRADARPVKKIGVPTQPGKVVKPSATAREFDGDYKKIPAFVDACYFDWMAAKSTGKPIADKAFEDKIIDYLDVLAESELAGANLIPRVPSVMVQLLKRMHEENVSGAELSRIITKDVVLLAAILNEVNSSFYNMNTKITELSQAILLLGHNRLRMVLAKLSFRPVYNDHLGNYTRLTSAKIWDESQQRALACYLLAKYHKVDPFMAFLAGLMQDVGLIVALRVFDRSSSDGDLPTGAEFRAALQKKSLILSTRIGQIWLLPEIVIRAIEAQGIDRTGLAKIPIAKVLNKADFISKTVILINAGYLRVDMEKVRAILSTSEMDCLISMLENQVSVATII